MVSLEQAIPPTLLFRFALPLRYHSLAGSPDWTDWMPDDALPPLGELAGRGEFGKVWGGWSENGLSFAFSVTQRSKPLWCRATRTESSDRVDLFINTRPAAMARRPTRFCVGITALPIGDDKMPRTPYVESLNLGDTGTVLRPEYVRATSALRGHDYFLCLAIARDGLPGFEPRHEPRVGFMCVFHDQVLGTQAFAGAPDRAVYQDPSLWVTLELVR